MPSLIVSGHYNSPIENVNAMSEARSSVIDGAQAAQTILRSDPITTRSITARAAVIDGAQAIQAKLKSDPILAGGNGLFVNILV